jgi:hypothetical protein
MLVTVTLTTADMHFLHIASSSSSCTKHQLASHQAQQRLPLLCAAQAHSRKHRADTTRATTVAHVSVKHIKYNKTSSKGTYAPAAAAATTTKPQARPKQHAAKDINQVLPCAACTVMLYTPASCLLCCTHTVPYLLRHEAAGITGAPTSKAGCTSSC